MWDSLLDLYGPGIGGVLTYQDFGEEAFSKRHPHVDLTLNGYRLVDGAAQVTPEYDLRRGGRKRWDQTVVGHARKLAIDARRGNVQVSKRLVGAEFAYKVLRYQLRELDDLRKLDYRGGKQTVYWCDYRTSRRTPMSVGAFLGGLYEYQERLGQWRGDLQRNLHVAFGIMNRERIREASRAIGGSKHYHGERCPCSKCRDWVRVDLPELEGYLHGHEAARLV